MSYHDNRFYIYPDIPGGGRAAIAVDYDREAGVVSYAIAWCSPKDQFHKKKGRMIASGRLDVGKCFSFFPKATTRRGLVIEVMEDIALNLDFVGAPQWVGGFVDDFTSNGTTNLN